MKSARVFIFLFLILLVLFTLPALCEECGHSWTYSNNGESGHTAKCTLCGLTRSDAHNLSSSFKQATCQSPAVTTYSCTLCSYQYTFTEGEKASGHAWSEYTIVKKATCRQAGLQTRTCADCGKEESGEIAQLEHNYGEWNQYDEKWHIRYCKVCDWAYKGSHRLNDGEITVKPTDTQLGIIRYTCRVCQDTFENIIRSDGTMYAMNPVDVLDNGVSYLLAASRDTDATQLSEVSFACGGCVDLRPDAEAVPSVYASSKTGNYAGISIEGGLTHLDVLPVGDYETLYLEFLHLKKNASASVRIFNATGALEMDYLDGKRVIIAQHKDAEGKIITLLMRFTDKRDSFEGEARLYTSLTSPVTITNKNGEYTFSLPEDAVQIGSVTFKYVRSSGKITVNARNQENSADGILIEIIEGIQTLKSASGVKTAESYVQLSDTDSAWRLRITYPSGYSIETPLFYKDGAYAAPATRYLMDESALALSAAIDPMPEKVPASDDGLQLPEPGSAPAVPSESAPPSSPAPESNEAVLLTGETVRLAPGETRSFACKDYPAIVISFDENKITVTLNGDTGGWTPESVTLRQQGGAGGFKILNAYAVPAEFNLEITQSTIQLQAQLKNASGKTQTVTLGTFEIQP